MKFPHYGKPSKQSRKSEKSGADSAERTIRTSSKAESFAKSVEKNWFVVGKVMVRCIFTVHLAMFPSQRKTSGTALTRSCTNGWKNTVICRSWYGKALEKANSNQKKIATKREIEQASGNIVRLESQKRSGYEQYVLGKLSKEKFLELKQGLENEITTLKQTKAEKEKELAVVQEELQRKKQIAGSTEVLLTADNLQQYVKKIEVDHKKNTYTEFVF